MCVDTGISRMSQIVVRAPLPILRLYLICNNTKTKQYCFTDCTEFHDDEGLVILLFLTLFALNDVSGIGFTLLFR